MFALLVKHNLMRDESRSDPELLSSSTQEIRPIHCEMVRQKLISDFFESSSLPVNIQEMPTNLQHQNQNSSVKLVNDFLLTMTIYYIMIRFAAKGHSNIQNYF